MIKADSDRLLKALLISIMFHAFMFAGMNLLDWFPELDIPERLAPVVLRIEKTSSSLIPPLVEEKADTAYTENPEQDEPALTEMEPKTAALSDTAIKSIPVNAELDPYADLKISDDSILPLTAPFQDEANENKTDYIPTGGNVINLEDKEPLDSSERVSHEIVSETGIPSIISEGDLANIEAALADTEDRSSIDSNDKTDQNRDLYTYSEYPIEFSKPGVIRKLVSKPVVNISAEHSSLISSERTVIIRFHLNADGKLYYFDMIQDSGYPALDNSIISQLRKWAFDKDPGAEDVEGTVTIILKGK